MQRKVRFSRKKPLWPVSGPSHTGWIGGLINWGETFGQVLGGVGRPAPNSLSLIKQPGCLEQPGC